MRKTGIRYAIAWLALAAAFCIIIGSLNWRTFSRLTERGVSGSATVIGLFPKNHNTVSYEYHVGDRTFKGQMQSRSPNLPPDQLHVGQSLVINYDPLHSEDSVLGDPKPMLTNETISISLVALIFPTLILFAWKSWQRSTSAQQTTQGLRPSVSDCNCSANL
ncbi:hypothetical protein BH11VER1_BH11VER1_42160 [soil metagenome]